VAETYVQPEVLKSHIAAIRAVLGDDRQEAHVHRDDVPAGYRFIAPVTEGASGKRAAASRPAKVLVGRDDALAQLHQCLERMSSKGERQIVFVTGEPGIGKTAVADAFIDRQQTRRLTFVLARGQCIEAMGAGKPITRCWKYWRGLCRGTAETRSSRSWRPRLPPGSSSFPRCSPRTVAKF